MTKTIVAMVAAVLCLAACAAEEPPFGGRAAAARVGEHLYAHNLISHPVVNARARGLAAAVDRDGADPDSLLREFDGWLGDWVHKHPEEVARARMLPRHPGQAANGTATRPRQQRGRRPGRCFPDRPPPALRRSVSCSTAT